jgi:hypothetical protein
MGEHLRELLKELDDLLVIESQALDRLGHAASPRVLDQIHGYEDRIDTLMAEIFAIGRYSSKNN